MNSIKRGDIWYVANSYAAVGSEQRAGRPAIIVSNDQNNRFSSTVEVVYLTTQPKRDLPTHVTIRSISRESTALCEQVTSVAVERVGDYVCHISDSEMAAIEDAMLVSLGIEAGEQVAACEETPPVQDQRLAEAEARCTVLQQMYDALLDRLLKAG